MRRIIMCTVLLFLIVTLSVFTGFYYRSRIGSYELSTKVDDEVEVPKSKFYMLKSYGSFNSYISTTGPRFLVFGKQNCHFCDLYKPVLEKLSQDYLVEIGYVNMTILSDEDYQLIMDSGLKIPAKCSKNGNTIDIKEGFGTPLGLFVRNGEVYDCIRGYDDYETLEILIKRIGYIE
ncbi:MAG TPA: hypothetical protein DCY94_04725 [Firmicutes bacterium]|nr:hypothetical protein [Bacillota bacterium]